MKQLITFVVLVLLCCLPWAGRTLPWSEDMRDQPSTKAQESEVRMNSSSVPVTGSEPYPPPEDTSELVRARLEAGKLDNPVQRTDKSIDYGKILYDRHCAVCHGKQGGGDGPVGKKYVPDPMNLTIDYVQLQPDGQLYYTITHGSIAMPYYRDTIPSRDRWHIINYIKAVFGQKKEQ